MKVDHCSSITTMISLIDSTIRIERGNIGKVMIYASNIDVEPKRGLYLCLVLLSSSRLAAVVLNTVVLNLVACFQSCRLLIIPPLELISIQPLAFDFTVFDDR